MEAAVTLLAGGAMGLEYFPDGAVAVLERRPRLRLLFAAGVSSVLVEGNDVSMLDSVRRVIEPGKPGSIDGGYAGVSAAWRRPGGRLYAAYHGEDHAGMAPVGHGVPGYYARGCLAASDDDGRTFQKLGPFLESVQRKDPAGLPDQGCGELCWCPERSGRWLLAYYVDHSREGGRGVQICLARADVRAGPPLPGTWFKYRAGRFDQPGLGGHDSPVVTGPAVGADATFPQVTYRRALDRYVMVFNLNAWREYAAPGGAPDRSGIYLAYSRDGIAWSAPTRLVRAFSVGVKGREVAWHPSVVWDDDDARTGWLLYAWTPRWGHAHEGDLPHFLVGRRLTLAG